MSPVCYDCNRRTKSELEDENKTNTFECLASLSDEEK